MLRNLFKPALVGHILGIPIKVMPAVAILTLFVLANVLDTPPTIDGEYAPGAAPSNSSNFILVLGLFAVLAISLLIHELAHALVARRLGFRVIDIVIWPLGGMARMEGMSDRPVAEAKVSLAGPMANLLLAAILLMFPGDFFLWAAILNLILGLGNLVPAFPMDGGRVLRAWLARSSPAADATKAAVSVASWLCVGFLFLALSKGNFGLGLLMCLYIWSVGKMELVQNILRTGRAPIYTTKQVFLRAWQGPSEPTTNPLNDLEDFGGDVDEFFDKRK